MSNADHPLLASADLSLLADRLADLVVERLRQKTVSEESVFAFDEASIRSEFTASQIERESFRRSKPMLPDPHFVKSILALRARREEVFNTDLFADPAWDMMLDLAVARAEHRQVSVTSLCIASRVPATTALRYIDKMIESGTLVRVPDPEDKRRSFLRLSDRAARLLAELLEDYRLRLLNPQPAR